MTAVARQSTDLRERNIAGDAHVRHGSNRDHKVQIPSPQSRDRHIHHQQTRGAGAVDENGTATQTDSRRNCWCETTGQHLSRGQGRGSELSIGSS